MHEGQGDAYHDHFNDVQKREVRSRAHDYWTKQGAWSDSPVLLLREHRVTSYFTDEETESRGAKQFVRVSTASTSWDLNSGASFAHNDEL